MKYVGTHDVEQRSRALDGTCSTAHDKGQRTVLCSLSASRNGRIEHVEPGVLRRLSYALRGDHVDRAAVDQQRLGTQMLQYAPIAEVQACNVFAGRQHAHKHINLASRIGRGRLAYRVVDTGNQFRH